MVAWIKHDKPGRLEHMPKLMEHVRLPLLSRDYLVQVMHFSTLLSLLLHILRRRVSRTAIFALGLVFRLWRKRL